MAAFDKLKSLLRQDVSSLTDPSLLRAVWSGDPAELENRLWTAVSTQDLGGVRKALDLGANPTKCSAQGLSPLHACAREGHAAVLSLLLASPLVPDHVDEPSAQGFTALSDAAAAGHASCVVMLLAANAQVQATGPRGVSVLHRAAAQANANVLRELFNAGANWHAKDVDGLTPLDVLAQHRPQAVSAWRRLTQAAAPTR